MTIPGPTEPAVVQSLRFLYDPIGHMAELSDRHGPVFSVQLMGTGELVYVTRPDLVRRVLTERETFENYSGDEILAPLIGSDGLILLTGERHLRRRKLLLPSFHGERLDRWGDVISDIAERRLSDLPREAPVAIRPAMQRITVEVICRVVFGVQDRAQLERLYGAIARWSSPRFALPLMFPRLRADLGPRSPWGALQAARAELRELLDDAISSATREADLSTRDDVLSMLVAATDEDGRPGFTHDELHDELMGLLFAGHDTTASALAWSCVLLADNEPAWKRLVAEARADDGGSTWADAVGRETLRLRPSVVAAGRFALKDTELDGVPIARGTRLGTLTLSGHDAENFAEPGAFRPQRWLGDEQPSNYASTPFGGGVHRCIGAALAGLEMRAVLHQLARDAAFLAPAPGRRDRHISFSAVLVPSRGGRVVVGRTPSASPQGRAEPLRQADRRDARVTSH